MTQIEEKYLQKLKAFGLHVSGPFSPTHAWPDGVRVGKPVTTPGNAIPGYNWGYIVIGEDAEEPPKMDAPWVVLYSVNGKWIVHSQECVPKPGPGDFTDVWEDPNDAVEDIIDFYFGDAERMNRKAARKAEAQERASQ